MKRIIHGNVIGTVLAEGRHCYFIRFPWGCRFLDKKEVIPTWERETKAAKTDRFKNIPQFVPLSLNA